MPKSAFIKAILVWSAILLVAIGNGALRDLVLVDALGATAARLASGILLCTVILAAAALSARWLGVPTDRTRWLVGALWLLLTLAFELGVGYAQHQSWERLLDAYRFQGGNLWPLVLLTTLIAPWAGARMRRAVA